MRANLGNWSIEVTRPMRRHPGNSRMTLPFLPPAADGIPCIDRGSLAEHTRRTTYTSSRLRIAAMEEEKAIPFDDVAMLPQPGDTAAACKHLLPGGTRILLPDGTGRSVTLAAPCLEGYRFAVRSVEDGAEVLSWGLPFGTAVGRIRPGDVLVNAKAAAALRGRLSGPHGDENEAIREILRKQAVNFEDLDVSPDNPYLIDERGFTAVGMNPGKDSDATFPGYLRDGGRGVGTRNHVAVVALTASASPTIAPLRTRWAEHEPGAGSTDSDADGAFDGVRIVAHTEGEAAGPVQHNAELIHRCLAGFLCHPNVGAAVLVTTGREKHITIDTLLDYVRVKNDEAEKAGRPPVYAPQCYREPHVQFVRTSSHAGETMRLLDGAVLEAVRLAKAGSGRVPCPLSALNIALQCGGSDSFSGLCGNPLTGAVAERLIKEHGGRAILAESPELVGSEPYILSRVSNEETARKFIRTTENYKEYGARHSLSVAGNPSGGNLYRGLYNIVLKSLGAARKKPPGIALDLVLEHGEPMNSHGHEPRYAFMDSPGNDLESIAGQVACGCNIIIFITGNGSMTNFPFAPTIKVVTTDRRYNMIKDDMDVNAGPYGHGGEDRKKAVDDAFDLCVRVASGERSKGEGRGHSQVSLWRNWAIGAGDEQDADLTDRLAGQGPLDGPQLCGSVEPYEVRPDQPPLPPSLLSQGPVQRARVTPDDPNLASSVLRPWRSGASFALIPTSLCSSAVAGTIRDSFLDEYGKNHEVVCPSHTEGCGAAGDAVYERRYQRLMISHALHPSISRALFLEHGCEKTHNDYFRNVLKEAGALDVEDAEDLSSVFGFWSLQLDGGFDNAKTAVMEYFHETDPTGPHAPVGKLFGIPWSSRPVSVGLLVDSEVAASNGQMLAPAMAAVVRYLSCLQVHVVLPINSPLISEDEGHVAVKKSTNDASAKPPTATGDMEDFFASAPRKAVNPPSRRKKRKKDDENLSTPALFAVEALLGAAIPHPTLVPGQMISQRVSNEPGGLHVMDLPKGATWDETVSCLSPACDMIILFASESDISMLPGSCLAPTMRQATPVNEGDSQMWHEWTVDTCSKAVEILRSPIIAGGEAGDQEKLIALQNDLFSMTTFVVPRGHAVSF